MTEEEEITLRSACREEISKEIEELESLFYCIKSLADRLINPSDKNTMQFGRKMVCDDSSFDKKRIRGKIVDLVGSVRKINKSLDGLPGDLFTDYELRDFRVKGTISFEEVEDIMEAQAMGACLSDNTMERSYGEKKSLEEYHLRTISKTVEAKEKYREIA